MCRPRRTVPCDGRYWASTHCCSWGCNADTHGLPDMAGEDVVADRVPIVISHSGVDDVGGGEAQYSGRYRIHSKPQVTFQCVDV